MCLPSRPSWLGSPPWITYAIHILALGLDKLNLGHSTRREPPLARRPSRPGAASSAPTSYNARLHGHANCQSTTFRPLVLTTALIVLFGAPTYRVRADAQAYDLVIQRSPADAGEVTPNTGAHRISANSNVTLTANAQPGYRFAYWLGDVSDPGAERTSIVVDGPKIVVAVFHPEIAKRVQDQHGSGGGGFDMLAATATDLTTPGLGPTGGAPIANTKAVPIVVPVVIAEPATIALLALGTLIRRPQRRQATPVQRIDLP